MLTSEGETKTDEKASSNEEAQILRGCLEGDTD